MVSHQLFFFHCFCPSSSRPPLPVPLPLSLFQNEKLLADETRLRQISERIPAGRWGEPADFTGPLLFLASAASQYVSGEMLVVDGVSERVCV